MTTDTQFISKLQQLLPLQPSSSIYTLTNQFKDVPLKNIYQLLHQYKFLPYRSAHLGSTWTALCQGFHIGTGVFHASPHNVTQTGDNLVLLDFNLIPNLINQQFSGDTLWWPGYTFKNGHFNKLNLFIFNPKTQQLVPASNNQLHLQTHLFLQDKTPLNTYHLQQLKQLGKTQTRTSSQIFNQNQTKIKQIISQLITSPIKLKFLTSKSVSWDGITQPAKFSRDSNKISYQNYHWTINEFVEILTTILTLSPTDNFSTRSQSLQQIYHQKDIAPLPNKEFRSVILTLLDNYSHSHTHIHLHSGGYDMAGARPFNHGYVYKSGLSNLKKVFTQATFNQSENFHYLLFPAVNFSIGSYDPKDIPILNQLISDYLNQCSSINFSKQASTEIYQLIIHYASKLSSDFWHNFLPMKYLQLPHTSSPSFQHPNNLLDLTFSQANYLVGHLRLFIEKHPQLSSST